MESNAKKAILLKEVCGIPVLFLIAGVLYALPVLAVIQQLGWFSESMSSWGQFGDFVGGVLNPTFGLISIWLLLANLKHSEKVHDEGVEADKIEKEFSSAISLISMYESKIYEMTRQLDNLPDGVPGGDLIIQHINNLIGPFKQRVDLLTVLIEGEFDKVVGGMFSRAKVVFDFSADYKGYSIQGHYKSEAHYSLMAITTPQGSKKLVAIRGAIGFGDVLAMRTASLNKGVMECKAIIDMYLVNLCW